jgi:hypothetical protein
MQLQTLRRLRSMKAKESGTCGWWCGEVHMNLVYVTLRLSLSLSLSLYLSLSL